jgi:hypothetical protein
VKAISSLMVRMAREHPRWGYPHIRGTLRNLGHSVARRTVAKVLKVNGIPRAPDRLSSSRTFLRAPGGAMAGADFFTTEVWTPRRLLTCYTLFVLDLRSRRVHVAGSPPDARFMVQATRRVTDAVDGFLAGHRVLSCERDGQGTEGLRHNVEGAGGRIRPTPIPAPTANADAERFVRTSRAA